MNEHEPYEYESHVPVRVKGISWLVCKRCGLIYLKNTFTDWCIKKGCNNEDHPGYENVRILYTRKE